MSIAITPIPAFNDNYIWCLHDQHHAWVVDPGCAASTERFLQQQRLNLSGILITHHHHDHTGGIAELVKRYPDCLVVGPHSDKIATITHPVVDNQVITLANLAVSLTVLTLPGHTLDHIGFYNDDWLFCGDTLFSGGCGRLFEGSPAQLHQSLQRLAALPGHTLVYCTHEYTCANLTFATMVEPTNSELMEYQQWCLTERQQARPTLPSTIARERAINPFLRCDQTSVRSSIEKQAQVDLSDSVSYFAALRRWKDIA
ncbi:hydroxyacylglutathione hydrolase [Ferrimonas senticii]|uniref:hydroxyacylglutathione hydrolase n=1 Tax=Ferrimonas senticii TaxID=394566 RepID=UPI000418BACC|nr:hydroxyacylglutathione hydrolase [Ferrimonas senticii]